MRCTTMMLMGAVLLLVGLAGCDATTAVLDSGTGVLAGGGSSSDSNGGSTDQSSDDSSGDATDPVADNGDGSSEGDGSADDPGTGDNDEDPADDGAPAQMTLRLTQSSSYAFEDYSRVETHAASGEAELTVVRNSSTTVNVPYTVTFDVQGQNAQGQQYVISPSYFVLTGSMAWTVTYSVDQGTPCIGLSARVADDQTETLTTLLVAGTGTVVLGDQTVTTFSVDGGAFVPAEVTGVTQCGSFVWNGDWTVTLGAGSANYTTSVQLLRVD